MFTESSGQAQVVAGAISQLYGVRRPVAALVGGGLDAATFRQTLESLAATGRDRPKR